MENNTEALIEGEDAKKKSANSEMGLEEVKNILSSLSLASVTIRDFLVVMRSDFDHTIAGEPYTGLLLLLNITTWKYFCRIWNQTVATGILVKEDQLVEVCKNHFCQGRPCLGCPHPGTRKYLKENFLISQTPVPFGLPRCPCIPCRARSWGCMFGSSIST